MTGASLPERPKTSESTAPVVAPAAVPEPASAESTAASDVAHVKRPYEKPIFNNEEDLKPTKIAKTDEEDLVASAAEDKKTIENLAGAGPASTAAYTAPEPVPVKADIEKVPEPPKAEEKKVEKAEPSQPAEAPKAAEKAPANIVSPTPQSGKAASNPDAIAAANAAITSSQKEKAAAPVEEPKKPAAALKRGEEPLPKTDAPKETETPKQSEPEQPKPEQPKADQPKTENKSDSEPTEEKEKKKGGFFGWLKRKFK